MRPPLPRLRTSVTQLHGDTHSGYDDLEIEPQACPRTAPKPQGTELGRMGVDPRALDSKTPREFCRVHKGR